MDIRRRMLFKKKASSSGGGGSTTGGSYTVNLNSQWEKTTAVANPDSTLYDGVYRSSSNYNVNNGVATMYITIKDCSSFKMYIRSYAESNYDYVMVSQLDQTINGNTSYSDTTLVKAHTRGNQQSGTALSSYTLVEFTGITSGEHTITVVYRKDSSVNNGDDRGYVLIEKIQAGSGDSGGDDVIPEPIIDINNYLTIEARENGLTASLSTNACEYCVDGDGNWKSLAAGTATESINSGQTLSFRGELTPSTIYGIGTFTISKKYNLKGNCMSMLFSDAGKYNYSLSGKYYAFYKLFYKCTNIVTVSDNFLPATTLAKNCYQNMFYNCTSLTTAPELPATTLNEYCYSNMFRSCTSLTTAPELPATTLAKYCYYYMFYGCTSLTTAPELPATTLATCCYFGMFSSCSSLTTTPELPATTLEGSCYSYMFQGCTNLTTAPELPATTLAKYCYESMFYGCSKLNYIKMLATDISASDCLYNWVYNVASTGTFVKNPAMNSLPTGSSGIPSGWTVVNAGEPVIDINNYLTIEAREDGLTASLSTNACEYCVDGDGNWKTLSAGTATESINTGQTLSFRGELTPTSSYGIGTFTISKKCNLKGNCMSMLFGDNAANNYSLSGKSYAFYRLFYNRSNIVNVSSNFLPATTLANSCYRYMFYGCTSLTVAPALPATTLADDCYGYMFYRCTSLTTAPELPATTLASNCYENMFQNCTSLTTAPALPATTLATYCYSRMFNGCTSLTTAPELPATTLATYCYSNMFDSCTSLTTAPELPATTLANYCYINMFWNCSSLTTAPELPAMTLANYCYGSMFSGCTNLTTAPELPATKLATYCYRYMFDSCTKLKYIKMLATDISASACLYYWVNGVASSGTFVKNPNMTTLPTATSSNYYAGIPSGWTVVNAGEPVIDINNYLTIEAREDGLTASLSTNACEYCVDGDGNWKTLSANTATKTINSGHTLSFRGELTPDFYSNKGIGTFTINKKCNLKGNCMSMLFKDSAANKYSLRGKDGAFCKLFQNCTNIVNVSSNFLPATTLADSCYSCMFDGCTSLTNAPELPATTLATFCYNMMFEGCTNLTTAPELPATTLAYGCYEYMFYGCTNLTTAPELPATTLANSCYLWMFYNCTKLNYIKMLATDISASGCLQHWVNSVAPSGTFVKHPDMTSLRTGEDGIPSGWTIQNATS